MSQKTQWMVLCKGHAYSKTLGPNHELYVLLNENGTWCAWRARWEKGNPKPVQQKTIVDNVSFEEAGKRANNYFAWWRKNRGWG